MFTERPPIWNEPGVEPPDSKKTDGWNAIEKPPADYFNWLFNRAYATILELQQNAVHKDGSTTMTGIFRASAGFVNEVRNNDPVNPEVGREWFRSDL